MHKLGYANIKPRDYTGWGWFAPWDGNLVGGLLLGVGMALAGACPGTVLVQAALGGRSGYFALQGALLAGIFWSGALQPWLRRRRASSDQKQPESGKPTAACLTIQDSLGGAERQPAVLAVFLAMCAAVVGGSLLLAPPSPEARIAPVLGGVLIGVAQLGSVLLRKQLMGVSSSYSDLGDWFWRYLKGGARGDSDKKPETNGLEFSLGMVGGAWLAALVFPWLVAAQGGGAKVAGEAEAALSPALALAGGFLVVVGSRIAGGCTSGHGISGISTFSIASLISVGAMFAAGAATALALAS